MKPTNVLLLDLQPSCDLSGTLRAIIESGKQAEIQLQQESVANGDHLRQMVLRMNPAVIFLVSPWNVLKQARSLFQSLRRELPEPPVVVVSDTDAPDEIYEMIKLGAAD